MRKTLILVAALAMIGVAGSSAANAQTIDKNGKCHAADGKMAKMDVCKAVKPAKAEQCRDASGKFAKCGAAGAKPALAATPAKATTTAKPAMTTTAAKATNAPAKAAAKPATKATNAPAKK